MEHLPSFRRRPRSAAPLASLPGVRLEHVIEFRPKHAEGAFWRLWSLVRETQDTLEVSLLQECIIVALLWFQESQAAARMSRGFFAKNRQVQLQLPRWDGLGLQYPFLRSISVWRCFEWFSDLVRGGIFVRVYYVNIITHLDEETNSDSLKRASVFTMFTAAVAAGIGFSQTSDLLAVPPGQVSPWDGMLPSTDDRWLEELLPEQAQSFLSFKASNL